MPRTEATKARIERIAKLLRLGVSKAEIARQEGISRQRLYQLIGRK